MKVLHISGEKEWGGNEQKLIYCIPALNSLGVENIVFGIKDIVLEKLCLSHDISFIGHSFGSKTLQFIAVL